MIVGRHIANDILFKKRPHQKTKRIQTFNRVLGVYSWGQGIGLDLFFLSSFELVNY